ncbi:MAG: hypothetical protein ABI707_10190 [Ferruginibacter sp.]
MTSNRQIDIEIDKLTRSIENTITGDSFRTDILPVSAKDLKQLKKMGGFLIALRKQGTKAK